MSINDYKDYNLIQNFNISQLYGSIIMCPYHKLNANSVVLDGHHITCHSNRTICFSVLLCDLFCSHDTHVHKKPSICQPTSVGMPETLIDSNLHQRQTFSLKLKMQKRFEKRTRHTSDVKRCIYLEEISKGLKY